MNLRTCLVYTINALCLIGMQAGASTLFFYCYWLKWFPYDKLSDAVCSVLGGYAITLMAAFYMLYALTDWLAGMGKAGND